MTMTLSAKPSQTKSSSMMSPKVLIIALAMVVLVIVVLAWEAPAISSFLQGVEDQNTGYTQLSLVAGVSQTYKHGNDSYVFSYSLQPSDNSGLFYAAKNSVETRSFPAVAGAVYSDLGLEMKVSSVTSDLMVLLVKPLP